MPSLHWIRNKESFSVVLNFILWTYFINLWFMTYFVNLFYSQWTWSQLIQLVCLAIMPQGLWSLLSSTEIISNAAAYSTLHRCKGSELRASWWHGNFVFFFEKGFHCVVQPFNFSFSSYLSLLSAKTTGVSCLAWQFSSWERIVPQNRETVKSNNGCRKTRVTNSLFSKSTVQH